MVTYDYSKFMACCVECPEETVMPIAERMLTVDNRRVLKFIYSEIAARKGAGWLSVWTEPKPMDDVVRGVFGEKCKVEKRRKDLVDLLKAMSYDNLVHGIGTDKDGELSLAAEPFLFSWRKLNIAVCALYPASILRLYSSFGSDGCPFPNKLKVALLRKKYAATHPQVRVEFGKRDDAPISEIWKYLSSIDPFRSIEKAEFKLDKVPRSILVKGVVGVTEAEASIVPIDTLFKRAEPERRVYVKEDDEVEQWRDALHMKNDCDLLPHVLYSNMVEYAMREIRRRKRLRQDYPFYVNVHSKSDVLKAIRKLEAVSPGKTWGYCRWIAETLDRSLVPHIEDGAKTKNKLDIVGLLLSYVDKYLKEGSDPGSLMAPSDAIAEHLDILWGREEKHRRFAYCSCIYGISVVCAYIDRCRERDMDADQNEMHVGAAKMRLMDPRSVTFKTALKATLKYASGHSSMQKYEAMAESVFKTKIVPRQRNEWPSGLYDFVVTMSSLMVDRNIGVTRNA
jgi:hypothetical protein